MPASIDLVYYNSPGFARNPFEVSPARTSIRKAIQSPSPEVSITDQLLYFQKDAGQPTRSNCIRARFVAQFAHKVGIGGIRLHIEFLPVATFHQGAYKPPGLTFNSDPGPVFEGPREPSGLDAPLTIGLEPSVLIGSRIRGRIATGIESYINDFHPPVSIPVTYYLPNEIVPEPATLVLMV